MENNQENQELINSDLNQINLDNYHHLESKTKTVVTFFERRADVINISIKTWLDRADFEMRRDPYMPLCFDFSIAGVFFVAAMNDPSTKDKFDRLDDKIREIARLTVQGLDFEFYSIDIMKKNIIVETKALDGGFRKPIIIIPPSEFDAIMGDKVNYVLKQDLIGFSLGYGATKDQFLKSLVN